ncbi:hypothetical protein [Mycobacterium sp. IS-3022]|uniref:hypothetical protein n=1 Tax=Mycobacterium sp. IS-3022 TaxID=1772277 RepID=UPI000741649A|nr:hypothetical protein [Mycobacterium sp. IS-3022]KUI00037.1 hypothetical protein AU188_18870 [Mycobacterium sp. IS-3022]
MNPRLAAGVGAVSVVLLLGGSGAAVASAHPGDSHGSDRGSSSDHRAGDHGRGSDDDGHGAGRRDHGSGARNGTGNRGGGTEKTGGGPSSRVGSGRDDLPQLSSSNRSAVADDSNAARRSAVSGGSADRVGVSGGSADRVGVSGGPVISESTAASEIPAGSAGGGSSPGSDAPGPRGSAFDPPEVTFGNGRSPGIRSGAPEPRRQAPAPAPAEPAPPPPPVPPPPPPPPPAPAWVHRVATPPASARQFVVAPGAGSTDPLWGIAGLLLIPAAGAVLGYRQARAAQAAERIRRP